MRRVLTNHNNGIPLLSKISITLQLFTDKYSQGDRQLISREITRNGGIYTFSAPPNGVVVIDDETTKFAESQAKLGEANENTLIVS